MIATHTMKKNGVVYRAGEEITSPDVKPVAYKEDTVKVDTEKKHYSKSDIVNMRNADLRKLASENGIERPEEYTGSELKKLLVERFGL